MEQLPGWRKVGQRMEQLPGWQFLEVPFRFPVKINMILNHQGKTTDSFRQADGTDKQAPTGLK